MTWTSPSSTSLNLDSLLWLSLAVSSLLLLVGLFAENCADFSDGLEVLKLRRKTTKTSGTGSSASWPYEVLYLSQRFLHGSLPAKITVSMYLTISTVGFLASIQKPVVLDDQWANVERVDDNGHTWELRSLQRGQFQIVICDTPQNNRILKDTNGQAGYTLRYVRWAVTGNGCSSVHENAMTGPLGFWWYKKDNVVVRTDAIDFPVLPCAARNDCDVRPLKIRLTEN